MFHTSDMYFGLLMFKTEYINKDCKPADQVPVSATLTVK